MFVLQPVGSDHQLGLVVHQLGLWSYHRSVGCSDASVRCVNTMSFALNSATHTHLDDVLACLLACLSVYLFACLIACLLGFFFVYLFAGVLAYLFLSLFVRSLPCFVFCVLFVYLYVCLLFCLLAFLFVYWDACHCLHPSPCRQTLKYEKPLRTSPETLNATNFTLHVGYWILTTTPYTLSLRTNHSCFLLQIRRALLYQHPHSRQTLSGWCVMG